MVVKHPVSEASEQSPFGSLSPSEFYSRHNVTHSEHYITNSRGLKLYTHSWSPLSSPPLGLIAVLHGFTSESSWLIQLTSILFAQHGFLVCAIDYQGHGLSDSLLGITHHIPDITHVVTDCLEYFSAFRDEHALGLPSFLYGESIGGAIALYIHFRQKGAWDGLVLNCAVCGVSENFKPPWPFEHLLSLAAAVVPKWRVLSTRGNIPEVSYKEEWKRKLAVASPRRVGRLSAATVVELMRICRELQGRLEEVEVALLIVHGGEDKVSDVACVEELYARARSVDKTIKVYPGMWHQLIGEPEDNVNLVFGDVVDWLKSRALKARG